jgi:hypothetical protein
MAGLGFPVAYLDFHSSLCLRLLLEVADNTR